MMRRLGPGGVALLLGLWGCEGTPPAPPGLSREALMIPETCAGCHPDHYREWSGSMHAYAAEDPVFRAMNARGQRETGGALADFCVRCHAPVAVTEGLTTDGLNLDEVPRHLRGVTCWFCHQVEAVEGTHNNPLRLADDGVMRGGLSDPVDPGVHGVAWSALHDRRDLRSSDLCGPCHDIVTPAGVHLERTYAEWQGSLFARPEAGRPLSCGGCHMTGRDAPAAVGAEAPVRRVHDHGFPGVDLALTPFPQTEAQRAAVAAFLEDAVVTRLCVAPHLDGVRITVTLDNAGAGHAFPSGAAQDRRVWVTLQAWAGETRLLASGEVGEGTPVTDDPSAWVLRDRMTDDRGREVHMFWDARAVDSTLLPPAVTADPGDPAWDHSRTRTWEVSGIPDRVWLDLSVRPLGLEVVDDLLASGDLDPAVRDALPTFTLASAARRWRLTDGFGCVPPGP